MLQPEVMDYYQRGGERDRLGAGDGRLEFLRTWDVLTRVLPAPPATVVDVGGATGVYAQPLAEAGYQVRLVDPVPEHVAQAAVLPGVTATVGDARTLPAADRSADAVLLLGPLYHLLDRADRVSAWQQAARVLRPGGIAVAATISRFASLFDGFAKGFLADVLFRSMVEHALATGVHRNPDAEPGWFTSAYFHHPDEIAAEVSDGGLLLGRLVAVEGPLRLTGLQLEQTLADPGRTEVMLDMLRRVENEPSLLGASGHLLVIAHHPS